MKSLLPLLLLSALAIAYSPEDTSTTSSKTTIKTRAGMYEKFWAISCLHGDKKIARVALLSEESKTILALMEVVHERKPSREERKRLMDAIIATATDAVKKEMAFDHSKLPTVNPMKN